MAKSTHTLVVFNINRIACKLHLACLTSRYFYYPGVIAILIIKATSFNVRSRRQHETSLPIVPPCQW